MKHHRTNRFVARLLILVLSLCLCLTSLEVKPALGAESALNVETLANFEVERIYGQNRFQTMVQIARKINSGKAQNVILTTGYDFPDAVAAVPLARQKNAPILLVDKTPQASTEAFAYLKDYCSKNANIYLLGGEGVLPESFITELLNLGFSRENIHRIAGQTRYDTSVEIAKQMVHDGNEFYLVSGDTFADALGASVVAATAHAVSTEKAAYFQSIGQKVEANLGGVPILLVPSRQPIPQSVINYIDRSARQSEEAPVIHVIGGPQAIPESSLEQLKSQVQGMDVRSITRIYGDNRYQTMRMLNAQAVQFNASYKNQGTGTVIPMIYLASGEVFPDALTGAVLAAKESAPLVLVNDSMPTGTRQLLSDFFNRNQSGTSRDTKIGVLGGTGVIAHQTVTNVDYIFNYGGTITETERVLTRAGSSRLGYRDGRASESDFAFPFGVVEAKDGTLYISDTQNHVIRSISTNGQVLTLAGKADAKDQYGMRVGGFNDGAALDAQFNQPKGLALDDSGNLYVADSGNGAIRVIESSGQVKTLISGLKSPTDLVLGPDGSLYVTETLSHRILKVALDGTYVVLAGGGYQVVDGTVQGSFADGSGEQAKFNEPTGLTIAADGTLYVADTGNQRIRAVTADGVVSTVAGSGTEVIVGTHYIAGGYQNGLASEAQFNFPSGVAVTADGRIFVADSYNHRIRLIHPDGRVETLAGNGHHGKQNGYLKQAEFEGPTSVYILQSGNILVVDQLSNLIREIKLDR